MKKLKTILQHDIIYYLLLFIVIVLYLVNSFYPHQTIYNEIRNIKFKIIDVKEKDYGLKLSLKGKEKVLGYLYLDESQIKSYKNKYLFGDEVLVTGKKIDISNNTVPNTFNYKKYLMSNKIYNAIEITSIEKCKSKKDVFNKVKTVLFKRTNKLKKSGNYVDSLLFGDSSNIDEDTFNYYRDIGISHLFAISGLHIAIFIYLLSMLFKKISNTKINFILILFVLFYMFVVGYTSSIQRAGIFTILLIINKMFNLRISLKNLLFFTLFIICVNNPLAVNNIGLQYSFVITLFLILLKEKIVGGYLKRLFYVSLIAFIVSYPITASNFCEINFLSIIYNMFFVPFVSFLLIPFVIITYIFPIADSILYLMISFVENVAHLLNDVEVSKVVVCKMNCIIYMSYYAVLCIIISKSEKFFLKILLVFFLASLFNVFNPFKIKNYIMFLDVGQGDSTFIKLKNDNILIDTGGVVMYSKGKYTYKLSKNKTIPYLKSVGENEIDTLVLTHGDADHMGEAKYLVSNFTVKKVIFNIGELNTLEKDLIKFLEEKNVKYYRNINELKVDNAKFYFLNTRIYDNENDNSSVIYFEFDNKKFLFMGDAGESKEQDILDKYNISKIDVLKVGHHGSNTSSSKEFIDRINPKYSIISVGKDNRYGHPNDDVLDNLRESKIYRTDEDGSIMFKIKDNKLKIETCSP